MIILQDSREQSPLEFADDLITEVMIVPLKVADYGCEFKNGYVPPVYFERKSLTDLFSTLGTGYDRFKRELDRAKEESYKIILIVEGTIYDILMGTEYSDRKGLTVLRQIFTLWIKYDLMPVFCKDRLEMSMFITHYYSAIGRKAIRDLKEKGRSGKTTL